MRKVECTAVRELRPTPDAAKTQFDRVRDQEQVAQLLHAGCTHMRKAFDIEDINLEELIAIDRASGSQWRTSFTLRMISDSAIPFANSFEICRALAKSRRSLFRTPMVSSASNRHLAGRGRSCALPEDVSSAGLRTPPAILAWHPTSP